MKLAQLDARSPIRLFEKLARDMVNLIVALIDGQRIGSFVDMCFLLSLLLYSTSNGEN